jgi:hypothetical protein
MEFYKIGTRPPVESTIPEQSVRVKRKMQRTPVASTFEFTERILRRKIPD